MDIFYFLGLAVTGFGAGLLGALLGLGGGVFVVPALVLIFHFPPIVAIGTSSVAVVATSTAGASTYVHNRLTNLRLGLVLLISTALAAVIASLIASYLSGPVLSGLFAIVLVYTATVMLRSGRKETAPAAKPAAVGDPLGLAGTYYNPADRRTEEYMPRRLGTGMGLCAIAGTIAGLLGVGGGIIQMPVMSLLMGVPLKVAAATSNFMIGVTATSAALVRYSHGDVNPLIAVPVTLFVFMGARLGAWLVPRTPNARLRQIFAWVAFAIAALMFMQAFGFNVTGR